MDKELEAYKELVGKEEYHRQYAQLYSEAKQKKTRFSEREYTNNPENLKQIKEKYKNGVSEKIINKMLGISEV